MCGATLVLVHVADGWAARAYDELSCATRRRSRRTAPTSDALRDRARRRQGFAVESRLAMGDPATEIIRAADTEKADLVAMATHGHRFVKDILLGATVDKVRHELKVPVLLLQAR